MEQTDTVLLFLMDGGAVMSSEGNLESFQKDVNNHPKDSFYIACHPVTAQMYILNVTKIISVQEVPRESVKLGPNKVVLPGGRIN